MIKILSLSTPALGAGAKKDHYRPTAVRRRLLAKMEGHSLLYHRQDTICPIEGRSLCSGRLTAEATSLMVGVDMFSDRRFEHHVG